MTQQTDTQADPFGASEDFYLFVSHSLIDGASGDCSELTEGKVPYFGRVWARTGRVVRLLLTASRWQVSRVHIVNGSMVGRPQVLIDRLPASNHDHLVNGMQVDNHGDLFIGEVQAFVFLSIRAVLYEGPVPISVVAWGRPGVGSITNGGFWNFSAYGDEPL